MRLSERQEKVTALEHLLSCAYYPSSIRRESGTRRHQNSTSVQGSCVLHVAFVWNKKKPKKMRIMQGQLTSDGHLPCSAYLLSRSLLREFKPNAMEVRKRDDEIPIRLFFGSETGSRQYYRVSGAETLKRPIHSDEWSKTPSKRTR
jgi:hypothetical protein